MSKTMITLFGVLAMTAAGCWCKGDPCERDDDEGRGRRGAWHRLNHDDDDDDDEDRDEVCVTDGGASTADAPRSTADAATGGSADVASASPPRDASASPSDAGAAAPDACNDPAPNP